MTEKNKMADLSHFILLILPCGRKNFKSCPCFLLKFVLRMVNKEFVCALANRCMDIFDNLNMT